LNLSYQLLQRLRDKSFGIWSEKEHEEKDRTHKGDCCFSHIIGLTREQIREINLGHFSPYQNQPWGGKFNMLDLHDVPTCRRA
jgi:hypothetical protein